IEAALDEIEPYFADSVEQQQVLRDLRRQLVDWDRAVGALIMSVPREIGAYKEFMGELSRKNSSSLGERTDQMIDRLEYALEIELTHRKDAYDHVNSLQEISRYIVLGSIGIAIAIAILRSEERRVGKECIRPL